jgi:arsenite oxidase small subunit
MTGDVSKSSPSESRDQQNPTNRRSFLKSAMVLSMLLLAGAIGTVLKAISGQVPSEHPEAGSTATLKPEFPRLKLATIAEIKPNAPVTFNYPLDNEPNILIKLGQKVEGGVGPDGDIVAYSQVCQHLGCIYAYQSPGSSPSCNSAYTARSPVGYCCCHGSIYDLLHGGKVLGGPSPRPVPMVKLEVDNTTGDIYAVGMEPPTIFGHCTGSDDVSCDLQGGAPVA